MSLVQNGSARAARTWVPVLVALSLPLLPFFAIGELPGERWLSATDDRAAAFALLGAGLLVLDVILPIPSSVVGVMLGARLGAGAGFGFALAGLWLGHALGYGLGRFAPERWVKDMAAAPGWLSVFCSRPVPVLAEAVTLLAGATRMPWWRFASATLAGDAVYAGVLSSTGAALLPEGWYLGALALPMLLIGVAWWSARKIGRRSATPRSG